MKPKPFRKYLVPVLFLIVFSFTSCAYNPKPIPENKKAFIGTWVSGGGFKIEIKSSGTADITDNYSSFSDYDKLNIGVMPEYSKGMLVEFKGESLLLISKPAVTAREYHIDKNPYHDGDTGKMILNGVVLIKQK